MKKYIMMALVVALLLFMLSVVVALNDYNQMNMSILERIASGEL